MLFVLSEEVSHGEIVEFQTNLTDYTGLSPAQRELNLVVALLLEVVVNVYSSVLGIRLNIGLTALFGVEMSHGLNFSKRTHERFTGE